MRALRQRGGGLWQGPVAAAIGGDRAHQRDAVVDPNRGIRFGGSAQRWTGVVSRVRTGHGPGDAADIINDRTDDRRGWREGIDVNDIFGGGGAGVAHRIGGGEGQRVRAVAQRRRWRKAPRAAGRRHAADLYAVIKDFHRGSRFCRAAEGRLRVVGEPTVGNRRRRIAHVIQNAGQHRQRRRRGVDGEAEAGGRHAGIACCIRGLRGKAVRATRQRGGEQDTPAAAAVRGARADQGGALIDLHGGKRFAGSDKARNGVVGCLPGRERAGDAAHVVDCLADNRRVRCRGINNQGKARRGRADVARCIGDRGGPGMAAVAQRR